MINGNNAIAFSDRQNLNQQTSVVNRIVDTDQFLSYPTSMCPGYILGNFVLSNKRIDFIMKTKRQSPSLRRPDLYGRTIARNLSKQINLDK